jgi:hypothetical protein
MTLPRLFISLVVENRLGQRIALGVHHVQAFGREYVFVAALTQQASSVVAKNTEHFAFQLREHFQLDARRFEMIEVRGDGDIALQSFWRWRFEWVGSSPLSPRCEAITANNQHNQLLSLLNISGERQAASA